MHAASSEEKITDKEKKRRYEGLIKCELVSSIYCREEHSEVEALSLNNKEVGSHESRYEIMAKQHRLAHRRSSASGIDNDGLCLESKPRCFSTKLPSVRAHVWSVECTMVAVCAPTEYT
jgi:hypothetical protein